MLPALTQRENEILNLLANGLTNRQIANQLVLSEATVENHIHHIFVKLGLANRAQAVAYLLRTQIIFPGRNPLEIGGNPS